MAKCAQKTEVYSRICGYCRPVSNWNRGKQEEFKERRVFATGKDHIGDVNKMIRPA